MASFTSMQIFKLNNARPKHVPLPVTKLTIEATTGHEALSFVGCIARYNQIHMALKDKVAAAQRMIKGIFCYKVMSYRMWEQLLKGRCKQSLKTCSIKRQSVMQMTWWLNLRRASSAHLVSRHANFWALLFDTEESRLTKPRCEQFKICHHIGTSKSYEVCKLEDSCQILPVIAIPSAIS